MRGHKTRPAKSWSSPTLWCSALLWSAVAVGLATPSFGQSLLGMEYVETKSTTIGPNGELFHIQAGMHLDLFPEDPAAGWSSVLALDVVRDGELTERVVIPGTEGSEIESDAALLADGDQLFVLWTSRAEDDLSNLELISFEAATSTWGTKVDVSGDALPLAAAPDLAVTRETVWLPAEYNAQGEETAPPSAATRTVVHVLWGEQTAPGDEPAAFYTPIVLTDGAFLGWNPVVELDAAFFGLEPTPAAGEWSPNLLQAASLAQGSDERSLVIGLPQDSSGTLINLLVRLLPEGLAALAEEARSHIIGVGLIQTGGGGGGAGPDYDGIAEAARSHIIGTGRGIHPGVSEYVANQVAERIIAFGALQTASGQPFDPDALEALAADAWAEAMDAGASLIGNQLRSEDLTCGVVHLGENALATPGAEATESRHQVEFCIGSEHALPLTAVSADAEHRILTSEDGTRALVAWQEDDGTVRYRRTEVGTLDGWTEAQTVPDTALDLDQALILLRSQVRVR